jgi:hypothetical protein
MIFLSHEINDELVWAVRCKRCGELYALRTVHAGEVSYPQSERIPCHRTGAPTEYLRNEFVTVWAP